MIPAVANIEEEFASGARAAELKRLSKEKCRSEHLKTRENCKSEVT